MSNYKNNDHRHSKRLLDQYGVVFFYSCLIFVLVILYFHTWMDPDRILAYPWATSFESDRNIAYKKFILLKNNSDYTDLIVGSSTSEVFAPSIIDEKYGRKSYLGGTGGSKTPYRFAQIKFAIENNPNLKRILYVSDLFEFKDIALETNVFYQKNIMETIPVTIANQIPMPPLISRIQDHFSYPTLEKSRKTLTDYIKNKTSKYESQFLANGTTGRSMVITNRKEPLESRVLRTAKAYEKIYPDMSELNPRSTLIFDEIIRLTKSHNIELVIIIPPWHVNFAEQFSGKLPLQRRWIDFLHEKASPEVKVVDFSFPRSIEKGISNTEDYWHDGVHFSHKSAEIILNEVYSHDIYKNKLRTSKDKK